MTRPDEPQAGAHATAATSAEPTTGVIAAPGRDAADAVLWRAFAAASPDLVLVLETSGTIVFINRVAAYLNGQQVVGRKVWEFATAGAEARIRAVLERVVTSREAVTYEQRGTRRDGTPGWWELCVIPVLVDATSPIERVLWLSTDISDRKGAQELIAQVNQAIVGTDAVGHVTYWNEAAERMYGWTRAEMLGQIGSEVLKTRWHGPGGRDAYISTLVATDAWAGEISQTTRQGDELVVDMSIRLLRDPDGKPTSAVAAMRDATERRRLEEQVRQSQKMEAIGLLAGGVAHDFNNLLAVILGFSELAARKLPPGHPVADQLSQVFDAARRGGELTRKLLAFSRKQIIQPRLLDLGGTVGEFTRLLSRILGEDVDLVVDAPPAPLVVRADPVQLEQVLLNLCTNARQAMLEGGTLRLTLRDATFDEARVRREPWAHVGSYAELAVTDTGIGMDDATRLRVFEPFFTTKTDGTGLGLATVYGIVRQHHGFVHVESAPGNGTTFRVFLPRAGDGEEAQPSTRVASSGDRRLQGTETILLAEDEPSLRALVTTTLAELGYRVVAVGDGEAAARRFAELEGKVDLVLLDVVMPRLDAREAYEKMVALKPDARVLVMTGYAPESTRLAALIQSGKLPVLEKPFTPEALAAKVRSVLDGR